MVVCGGCEELLVLQEELREIGQPVLRRVLGHPFWSGLRDGSLPFWDG